MSRNNLLVRVSRRLQQEVNAYFRPEARQLRHLRREIGGQPRYQAGTVDVWNWHLKYSDAPSCISAFDYIVNRGWIDFEFDTTSPRILDCGANIGLASLYYKRRIPGARITAFEPDKHICAILRSNLCENSASDVEVVEAALWDTTGTAEFASTGDDAGRVASISNSSVASVSTVSLVNYLQEPVDLLKLDIEGAEGRVIADCAPHLQKVRRIILEYHFTDDVHNRLADLLQILDLSGFIYDVNSPPFTWNKFPPYAVSISGDWMRNWLMIYAMR